MTVNLKYLLATCLLLFLSSNQPFAQTPNLGREKLKSCEEKYFGGDSIYTIVDQPAVYGSGFKKFHQELVENIRLQNKNTPGFSGTLYLSFIINKEGRVVNFCSSLENIAVEEWVYKNDGWQPAVHQGDKVNQRIFMPIYIKLE